MAAKQPWGKSVPAGGAAPCVLARTQDNESKSNTVHQSSVPELWEFRASKLEGIPAKGQLCGVRVEELSPVLHQWHQHPTSYSERMLSPPGKDRSLAN